MAGADKIRRKVGLSEKCPYICTVERVLISTRGRAFSFFHFVNDETKGTFLCLYDLSAALGAWSRGECGHVPFRAQCQQSVDGRYLFLLRGHVHLLAWADDKPEQLIDSILLTPQFYYYGIKHCLFNRGRLSETEG